jgi:hypothetical protein
MPNQLVAMRLNQMHYKHPNQNNSKRCNLCGARVGIYPSGQQAMKKDPTMEIICNMCAQDTDKLGYMNRPAPGAIQEAIELRKKRNEH